MQLTDTACVLDYKELSNQTPSALMGFNFIVKNAVNHLILRQQKFQFIL